jgi:hypothetical protein
LNGNKRRSVVIRKRCLKEIGCLAIVKKLKLETLTEKTTVPEN